MIKFVQARKTVRYFVSLLCIVAWTAVAYAQEVVKSPDKRTARMAESFWTAERKANALPATLREAVGTPVAAPAGNLESVGEPGLVLGNLPAEYDDASSAEARAHGEALRKMMSGAIKNRSDVAPQIGLGSTVWYDYPPPSTLILPIMDYYLYPVYPHTAVGKLFFSLDGGNYVCSASSVTSEGTWGPGNRQMVVTAGHCCSDGAGTWGHNWLFEPAHLAGSAPLGSWTAEAAWVFPAWHDNGDLSRDICVLQMNTLNNQNINDEVGALGYAWNQQLPQQYHATGWPAAAPFTGGHLFISAASDAETDTLQAGDFPFTHGIGSAMTPGSSGGAWIVDYQPWYGENAFNGLNSYKYTSPDRPLEMFGPYIDDLVVNELFQAAATAPPAP